jgi:hypothetical protein
MVASPNPGGQHRRLVRTTIAQWFTAQRIPGVDHVYRAAPPAGADWYFENFRRGQADYSCLLAVVLPEDSDDFVAFTGPTSPGGFAIHYRVELHVRHRSWTPGEQDWADDEDDYDRIYDALKDCLRASGRDFGRPDVVLQAGVWPRLRAKVGRHMGAVLVDGPVDRAGVLTFNVTQQPLKP